MRLLKLCISIIYLTIGPAISAIAEEKIQNLSDVISIAGKEESLRWEYYLDYGYIHEPNVIKLSSFSLMENENSKYPYSWCLIRSQEWLRNGWEGPIDEYVGEDVNNQTEALLRAEDGKVYVDLKSFKVMDKALCKWFECPEILSVYDSASNELKPYTPGEDDDEVVLYDFTVKNGDRYRSIVFGSVISDVTVINTGYISLPLGKDGEEKQVKYVEVFPDYAYMYLYGEVTDSIKQLYAIKYAEEIGNINLGSYIYLLSEPYVLLDNGYNANYCINNIYSSSGTVIYPGRNFEGYSGINEIITKTPNSTSDTPIYDLHGRQISNPLPGTVYIRNGKKYVK